ncbi:MAG: PAS domain-containing protein [Bacteroidales bacterium]|nr:PAS domain-containing protein [Bacteroidales bacterium]
MKKEWFDELEAAITVCDKDGIIVYMNDKSVKSFEKDGGKDLIGSNLLDCHPGESRNILEKMLKSQKENIYTIEKNKVRKIIIQKPVFCKGIFDGFIEMSIVLPENLAHHKRA